MIHESCVSNWSTHSPCWPTDIRRIRSDTRKLCFKMTHSLAVLAYWNTTDVNWYSTVMLQINRLDQSLGFTDTWRMPTNIQRLCSKSTYSLIVLANWYTNFVFQIDPHTRCVGLQICDRWLTTYDVGVLNWLTRSSCTPTYKRRMQTDLRRLCYKLSESVVV